MHTAQGSRSIVTFLGALALIASCRPDQQTITDVPHFAPSVAGITSTTVVLSPTADTRLGLNAVNYSTDTLLTLYTWPNARVANAILIKVDLSSIPAGVTVSSATLSLYQTDADATADPTYTATVHRIINVNPNLALATGQTYNGVNGWTPNACCDGNVPLAQADISAPVDAKNLDKADGPKQWDVTSLIQGWLNTPSTNLGLLVNSDASKLADHWRYFSSSESPTPSQRPYLTVTYTASPSATQSSVSAFPTTISAGSGSSTITVTARDAAGNPISGASVVLSASGTGNTLTQPTTLTDAQGVATGSLTSTDAENKTVSATINGVAVTQTATVTVTGSFSPPDILAVGFESGAEREGPCGTGGVNCAFWSGVQGQPSYSSTQSQCRSGTWCAVQTVVAGACCGHFWVDESDPIPANTPYYVRVAYKFPTDWRFPPDNPDWKMILLRFPGSFYVNLQPDPDLAGGVVRVLSDGDGTWRYANVGSETGRLSADGLWHTIELYVNYPAKHWTIWIDGVLTHDHNQPLMNGDSPSTREFGAYANGTASATHTFLIDDIAISTQRIGP